MKQFYNVLFNTLIANVTTSFLWFALTFWVYLETKSVLATAIIGGGYMLFVAIGSLVWGTFIDKHKKKSAMIVSSVLTLVAYSAAGLLYILYPENVLVDWSGVIFWLFTGIILAGGVVENMRSIALSTVVTIVVPKEVRDRANGLVGMVQGLGFLVTSVFSGLAIATVGMGGSLAISIGFTAAALLHLLFVKIDEKEIVHDPELASKRVDIKGAIAAIRKVPGLGWLIVFTTFNNLIGGVFMALMDPYGLTLFSVQVWGFILGLTSTGFIIGGLLIAKKGLGKSPLRSLLLANIGIAVIGFVFTIREIGLLFVIGTLLYMTLMPYIEAAEQTIIQRVVPLNRQGRVFGFAQSAEAGAAPISAFMIGPVAEFVILPFMRTESGRQSFGWLLGDGEARGIALVFVIASMIMLVAVIYAFMSRAYKVLGRAYAQS